MRTITQLSILISILNASLGFCAENVTTVSVTKFTNKAASSGVDNQNCQSLEVLWTNLGDAFADVLIEKLESSPRIEVMEREMLSDIYDQEVNLKNSDDKTIEKGKFKKAKITFVGVVDGFEYCESGERASLDVGALFGKPGLSAGVRSTKASISVLIRAINTSSGKVLATARAKKEQSKRGIGLSLDRGPLDFHGSEYKQTALGEVIHDAIFEASDAIMGKLKI